MPRDAAEEQDLLPEHTRYRDDGCDISPRCLACPLPKCKYDDPGWLQQEHRVHRDTEILRMYLNGTRDTTELARRFSISRRTVQRVVQRSG